MIDLGFGLSTVGAAAAVAVAMTSMVCGWPFEGWPAGLFRVAVAIEIVGGVIVAVGLFSR